MVLGDPVAVEATAVDQAGQPDAGGQGFADAQALPSMAKSRMDTGNGAELCERATIGWLLTGSTPLSRLALDSGSEDPHSVEARAQRTRGWA